MKVFDHQAPALEEIIARAKAFYSGAWRHPSLGRIKPRFASLVVGGTGVGKTALATIAAEADGINATLLRISAPGWIPSGAHNRGVTETLVTVAEHITHNARTLLVVDEIDKICSHGGAGSGQDAWLAYARGEVMDLVDGRWPEGLRIPSDDDELNSKQLAERLTTKLRNTVFIIGIGTFQDYFDSAGSRRTMGFVTDSDESLSEISAVIVAERLPRELANRFNSNLIRLPELRPMDYQTIARHAADSLPEYIREQFLAAAIRQIPGAIAAKKGVRFLEEAMLETLKDLPPEAAPLFAPTLFPSTTTEPPTLECIL